MNTDYDFFSLISAPINWPVSYGEHPARIICTDSNCVTSGRRTPIVALVRNPNTTEPTDEIIKAAVDGEVVSPLSVLQATYLCLSVDFNDEAVTAAYNCAKDRGVSVERMPREGSESVESDKDAEDDAKEFPNMIAKGHNPDRVTNKKLNSAAGYRLLNLSEIESLPIQVRYAAALKEIEAIGCPPNGQWWDGFAGANPARSYRTKLTVQELYELRCRAVLAKEVPKTIEIKPQPHNPSRAVLSVGYRLLDTDEVADKFQGRDYEEIEAWNPSSRKWETPSAGDYINDAYQTQLSREELADLRAGKISSALGKPAATASSPQVLSTIAGTLIFRV